MNPKERAEQQRRERNDTPAEIRVTDRRRRYLDENDGDTSDMNAEVASLKPSYVEELEGRVRAAERKTQEVQARFEQLRSQLQRETDETRQRLNRAADQRTEREKAAFIAGLLPVLDNLQRATDAAESGSSAELIAEGVRRTASSFENALAAAGVQPVAAAGEQFDPQLHEAVETIPVAPAQDGKVVSEFTRGYKMGDTLLRPARVQVGRGSEKVLGAG
ncbi:MAG: nucleotide exchange factor GrpE [Acidobacteriota bacterium]